MTQATRQTTRGKQRLDALGQNVRTSERQNGRRRFAAHSRSTADNSASVSTGFCK
ncbi:MAG: hypothetical protein QOG58_1779 [Caballeronia sp.]|nr:hypothetical protein [Caballeronia sp.]